MCVCTANAVWRGVCMRHTRSVEVANEGEYSLERGGLDLGRLDISPSSLDRSLLAPIDRLLPRSTRAFLWLVMGFAVGCWGLALALAPERVAFTKWHEWQIQPFYISVHFIAVRMFINIYTLNFRTGVLHLDVPLARSVRSIRLILGLPGLVVALLIAAPFCISDYHNLHTDRYADIGGGNHPSLLGYELWGIWSLEWFLNALMWVILLGFLWMNWTNIRTHAFRSAIDVVLREKHYKPFLQMSAQGATVVLVFSTCTIIYVWFTGGELTDYLGLAITGTLLVVGFLPPLFLIRSKIDRAVRSAMTELRQKMPQGLTAESWPDTHSAVSTLALQRRIDEVLVLLRVSHLENLYRAPGQSEVKAVVLRLLTAPAATAVWHVYHNWGFVSKLAAIRSWF
jgi:hypothetical protein